MCSRWPSCDHQTFLQYPLCNPFLVTSTVIQSHHTFATIQSHHTFAAIQSHHTFAAIQSHHQPRSTRQIHQSALCSNSSFAHHFTFIASSSTSTMRLLSIERCWDLYYVYKSMTSGGIYQLSLIDRLFIMKHCCKHSLSNSISPLSSEHKTRSDIPQQSKLPGACQCQSHSSDGTRCYTPAIGDFFRFSDFFHATSHL
jgi:hypothetical protein